MSAMEQYLRKVKDVLASARDILTNFETAEVEQLIEHGECPEALRTLAWIIVEENKRVSRNMVESIRSLTHGMIDDKHMPPNLEKFVLD